MTTRKPRKHNPDWADNTRKERQQERRERLKQAAQVAGYETIDKLAAAILSGEVKIEKNSL